MLLHTLLNQFVDVLVNKDMILIPGICFKEPPKFRHFVTTNTRRSVSSYVYL